MQAFAVLIFNYTYIIPCKHWKVKRFLRLSKPNFHRKILLKPELRFFGIIEKLDLEFLPKNLCLNIGDY